MNEGRENLYAATGAGTIISPASALLQQYRETRCPRNALPPVGRHNVCAHLHALPGYISPHSLIMWNVIAAMGITVVAIFICLFLSLASFPQGGTHNAYYPKTL